MSSFFVNSLNLILDVFSGLFFALLMFRVWFRACHISFRTPIYQQIIKATNFIVRPLQFISSPRQKHDVASLLAAVLIIFLVNVIKIALLNVGSFGLDVLIYSVLFNTLIEIIRLSSQLLFIVALVYAITSWVQPHSHLYQLLGSLLRPLLAPFDRFIPTIGGISLSLIVFMLVVQITSTGLILALQNLFFGS